MSLDGLRAWIGEVERKLGIRTKVMLALATIAIAIAGTGIYLAIDTRDNAVSEKDVQELQQELEARIGTGGTTDTTALEAEIDALRTQVEELQSSESGGGAGNGNPGGSGGGSGAGTGGGAGGIGSIPTPEGGAPATPGSGGEE